MTLTPLHLHINSQEQPHHVTRFVPDTPTSPSRTSLGRSSSSAPSLYLFWVVGLAWRRRSSFMMLLLSIASLSSSAVPVSLVFCLVHGGDTYQAARLCSSTAPASGRHSWPRRPRQEPGCSQGPFCRRCTSRRGHRPAQARHRCLAHTSLRLPFLVWLSWCEVVSRLYRTCAGRCLCKMPRLMWQEDGDAAMTG